MTSHHIHPSFASQALARGFEAVRDSRGGVLGGTQSFYADEPGARILQEALQLTHAAEGANVILRIPNDETLFEDAVEPAPGIFCTNPVVTYLDLWNGNDRAREAADHPAATCFPWL